MPKRYLFVDCLDTVGRAVVDAVAGTAGEGAVHRLQAMGRDGDERPAGGLVAGADIKRAAAEHGPFDVIVIGPPIVDESEMIDADSRPNEAVIEAIDSAAKRSLDILQAALLVSLDRGDAQIWSLGLDDAFAYYLEGMPVAPIVTQTRVSCMRTLSREYARMGVRLNSAIFQPPADMVSADALKKGRKDLKTYSMRHKLVDADRQASLLTGYLAADALALNGATLCLGTGVNEFNI
ncbi:hypothetical protein [Fodinicurvata sp. EGI_FJ10296]|uniref:hypothetical protein n=1 Tax=Fodinicurvata sp. EGI_FJ10296 TaxID=3231908 RepID=UPI003454E7D4